MCLGVLNKTKFLRVWDPGAGLGPILRWCQYTGLKPLPHELPVEKTGLPETHKAPCNSPAVAGPGRHLLELLNFEILEQPH